MLTDGPSFLDQSDLTQWESSGISWHGAVSIRCHVVETVSQDSRVSTEAERPQQLRGTAVSPLLRTCCSHCGKSGPSWQRRRKPFCPTRQKWKAHRWAGSPVLCGASRPCPCTSSPESSPCPCWAETRTNSRLEQGFNGLACNHMSDGNPAVSLKIPQKPNTSNLLQWHKGWRTRSCPNLHCLLIPHHKCTVCRV